MALPTPNLDDLTFQQLVDHAKKLIPRYCPEWTDHNVSDPGVTLIELFASMTEMLLYRVNQVPDRMYIKFLELLGVTLEAPLAAQVPVTFYLSAAQPTAVVIAAGTEVATLRTETQPAIIFTTEQELAVRPPRLRRVYSADRAREIGWAAHDLQQAQLLNQKIPLFPSSLRPGDAFYLAFEDDHSHHVLALQMAFDSAQGTGVDPRRPPISWQVCRDDDQWYDCEIEVDSTYGFNSTGEIIVYSSAMSHVEQNGVAAYWLRCALTDAQDGPGAYEYAPLLTGLTVEARGGTALARHAVVVHDEPLGISDGSPGQRFQLLNLPLLSRDPTQEYLIVTNASGQHEDWQEVSDFAESGSADRHYMLDSVTGVLTLGPLLPQPDGTLYSFGATPAAGSSLRFSRYRHGGGVIGNVARAAIATVKTSIPYVARVSNRTAAGGGKNAQNIEDAKTRAPRLLRMRNRAVTADDFAYLAAQVSGVARACCLSPGALPATTDDIRPGHVVVLVLATRERRNPSVARADLSLPESLRAAVLAELGKRSLISTSVDVRSPRAVVVTVELRVKIARGNDPLRRSAMQQQIEQALYRFLDPYEGGPQGDGWPFGRALHAAEIYNLLQRSTDLEFVEQCDLRVSDTNGNLRSAGTRIDLPPDGLICSGKHGVVVIP
jgi:predicted phage baseplate assembly protein